VSHEGHGKPPALNLRAREAGPFAVVFAFAPSGATVI
jgi:hypothetical protein